MAYTESVPGTSGSIATSPSSVTVVVSSSESSDSASVWLYDGGIVRTLIATICHD